MSIAAVKETARGSTADEEVVNHHPRHGVAKQRGDEGDAPQHDAAVGAGKVGITALGALAPSPAGRNALGRLTELFRRIDHLDAGDDSLLAQKLAHGAGHWTASGLGDVADTDEGGVELEGGAPGRR